MTRYEHSAGERRIRAALATMPYGGGRESIAATARKVGFRGGTPTPIDLDDVGAYLEALSSALQQIAFDAQDDHERLTKLEADIAAFRRVLGVKP
jgi:hypothetical protein